MQMNKEFDNMLENKWWQETAVIGFSFTIYALKNDWMLFGTLASIFIGLFFYFILYFHTCN